MTLEEEIFPSGQHVRLVQTRWTDGWEGVASGFAGAAKLLTDNRSQFGATIDQVGLAIIYLQRHRVEIAMKSLLFTCTGNVKRGHNLCTLWNECKKTIGPSSEAWTDLARNTELVALLQKHDGRSTTFRYPADTKPSEAERGELGNPGEGQIADHHDHEDDENVGDNVRPPYVDLEALEKHVENFVWDLRGYCAYIEENQQLEAEVQAEMRDWDY